jgi:4-hydroxy-4-methyl-2-oxoglutarate aldolase
MYDAQAHGAGSAGNPAEDRNRIHRSFPGYRIHRPRNPGPGCPVRLIGTAVTVRVIVPDSVMDHYALGQIRPHDFLVIDRGQDQRTACWGDTTAMAAVKAGVTGLAVRETTFPKPMRRGLPIWCRSITPLTTKYRDLGGEVNIPISCGGVAVAPGDIIMADENGVLVIPRAEAHTIAEQVVDSLAREQTFMESMQIWTAEFSYGEKTEAAAMVQKFLPPQK